ncbi:MAG: oligoribonuclease [Zetaproteobacteria bacterium]|nr:oligoribonuclease [Zetaproteobacteria bacterium]
MVAKKAVKWVWMDLEMTGLYPESDTILEIATLITDTDLNILEEGPELVIHQEDAVLARMDAWNQSHHGASGLIQKVKDSQFSMQEAEQQTLAFIQKHIPEKNAGVLAGNSIWQDRRFLINHMPQIDQHLHYRMLDVTSIRIPINAWFPKVRMQKKENHRALDDIRESLEELKLYRERVFHLNESGD